MKVHCLTVAIGREYTRRVQRCLHSRQSYCAWHGFDLTLLSHPSWADGRPPAWAKVRAAAYVAGDMNEGDVLVVADADVMVCNYEVSLREVWDERYDHLVQDVVFCSEPSGLNTGVFFVRISKESRAALDAIWSQTSYIHDTQWEQRAARHLYDSDPWFQSVVHVEPEHRVLHSYPPVAARKSAMHFEPGDFQMHFAGFHGGRFGELVAEYGRFEGGQHVTT